MRKKLCFVFCLLFGGALFSQELTFNLPKSKYGLAVVNDPEIYKKVAQSNPENQFLDLRQLIPEAKFDVTYAGTNNDYKRPLYESPDIFMRKPAALALAGAQKLFKEMGFGMILFDGYRPYEITILFYERTRDTNFVADPRVGSKHNRGMAIDLSLYDLKTGKPLSMPCAYDETSPKASHSYMEGDAHSLEHREALLTVMEKAGFKRYPQEWWHYDFPGWEKCLVYDLRFKDIIKINRELTGKQPAPR